MHLIIVEGIDRIGKTTFINKLAANLRLSGKEVMLDLHKSTWVPDIPLNKKPHCYEYTNAFTMTYFIEVMNMLKHNRNLVMIVDRYHVSSLVYGIVKRPKIIRKLYGSQDHFKKQILDFELALMDAVGEDRLHYVQFISKNVGIPDPETTEKELRNINLRMGFFAHISNIKSKHRFYLNSDENFQTDILTHIPTVKNLTL